MIAPITLTMLMRISAIYWMIDWLALDRERERGRERERKSLSESRNGISKHSLYM